MENKTTTKVESICYHCGVQFDDNQITLDDHVFCCNGCSTVYELLKDNNLCTYYDLNDNAGISLKSKNFEGKFDYLSSSEISDKLLDFKSDTIQKVTLYIPGIHCSSCVWLLENFPKIKAGVFNSRLNFVKKTLSLTFDPSQTNLKELVELLATLGYEPFISYEDNNSGQQPTKTDNHLIRQIAVVGFCMGNIMLLSFPEYFNIQNSGDSKYQLFFLYLNFILAIPVYFYGGWDYLKGSLISLRTLVKKETTVLSIDLPIAIGITALFVRSLYETFANQSAGYWDSLAGLVFFLLVGKWVQKKTFEFLTFERTFKSYFPLAVFVKNKKAYHNIAELSEKDIILIKNEEIIPADGVISKGIAHIDYSFVTGESELTKLLPGDGVFAGGRQLGEAIEITVSKKVDNSYLTQLWNDAAFKKSKKEDDTKLSQGFIKYFTLITLGIALVTGIYWYNVNPSLIWPSVTAVLMVACPCALTLSMPFTMGTVMGILGKNKFFIRSQEVIQKLQEIDDVVFDKTGTLTSAKNSEVLFYSDNQDYNSEIFSLVSQSSHPLSKAVCTYFGGNATKLEVTDFQEFHGEGISGKCNNQYIKIGTADFCNTSKSLIRPKGKVYVAIDGFYQGCFEINTSKRKGAKGLLYSFKANYNIHLLSGDNDSDKMKFAGPFGDSMHFGQKPEEKLKFINTLNQEGKNVLMIGDGLNDAGALQKSQVGIVISEDTNRFSPACDAILDASVFDKLVDYLKFGKAAINIVKLSFLLSVVYNVIGIGWAVTGSLSPVLAAIFMPLSSISVVLFSVGITYLYAYHKNLLNTKSWT
ncbi:Cu+-exporting ATPase [Spirosomataceae bacterium TFI 002]|nr:Cu+-exporting ATPase [Spirosomataceae bacterium TFI 002]